MATSVLMDDTDPRITYSENWSTGLQENNGPGSYYNRTFHQLESSTAGGTVSFKFEGISFQISGSASFVHNIVNGNSTLPATPFTCTVDSSSIPVLTNSGLLGATLCESNNLTNGNHTVTLKVASNSTEQPQLFLDYIMFTPLSSESILPSEAVFLPSDSSQLDLPPDSGFSFDGSSGAMGTSVTLSINYTGRSVTWFNCPENSFEQNPSSSTVSYDIDNGALSSYSVLDNTVPVLFSAMLDTTGPHELHLSYSGTQTQDMLTFCGLGVSPGPINDLPGIAFVNVNPTNGTGPSLNTTSVQPQITDAATGKKGHTAVIAGVVAGVVVIAAVCVLGGVLFKRYNRKRKGHVYQSTFVDGRD